MKYIIFLAGLLLVVPAGAVLAAYSRRIREILFVLLLASTAFIDRYDINFVYRGWYHSPTRGLEISFVDLLALILLLSTMATARREGFRFFWPASLGLMLAYLGYCCLSITMFDPKFFGMLEFVKLLRGMLAFLVVVYYVRSERDVYVFVITLGAVLVYEGCFAILQRYFWGNMMRVQGSFIHPSALADYCCTSAPLLLAVCLTKTKPLLQGFCAMAWALASIATILSITRMGITAFMVASAGVLMVSLATHMTPRNIAAVLMCAIVGGGLFFRGYDKMAERHAAMSALEENGLAGAGRKVYYIEAWNMANRNPFGVGLNNWSWWLSDKSGVPYQSTSDPGDGDHVIMAHSAFALTLGELGWPGFLIFLALWGRWAVISGRYIFVRKPAFLTSLLSGCFFVIVAAFLAALTEHNFRNQLFFIFFNIVLGFMVAVRRIHINQRNQEVAETGFLI